MRTSPRCRVAVTVLIPVQAAAFRIVGIEHTIAVIVRSVVTDFGNALRNGLFAIAEGVGVCRKDVGVEIIAVISAASCSKMSITIYVTG
jgi:hypothetical protein